MILYGEHERIGNDEVLTYFKVLVWHSLGLTDKSNAASVRIDGALAEIKLDINKQC
jgi:hypothetical protein